MSDEIILEVKNLTATYPYEERKAIALENVSFKVYKGDTFGILGESGSGKSTLGYAILGLGAKPGEIQPAGKTMPVIESGEIIFMGKDILKLSKEELLQIRGKDLTYVFQGLHSPLNPMFEIGDQTGEPVEVHENLDEYKIQKRVIEFLGHVRIADAIARYMQHPQQFSGGEAQRILIAMALIEGPKLTYFDEPTSALDVTTQRQIMNLIIDLREQFGFTSVITTHNAGIIGEMTTRTMVLYGGRVMEIGDTRTIFKNAGHPYTRGLILANPSLIRLVGRRYRIRGIPGNPPSAFEDERPRGCIFHPRCEFATDECREKIPELKEVEPGHFVACHRYEELPEFQDMFKR